MTSVITSPYTRFSVDQLASDVKVLDDKVTVIVSQMEEDNEDVADVKKQVEAFLKVRYDLNKT